MAAVTEYRSQKPGLLAGALSGLLASIPMGIMMIGLNRANSSPQAAPEPPKQITREMAERADAGSLVPVGQKWGLATWLGHLGYGAATASLYPITSYRLPVPHILRGMIFALSVWAGSYQGWLPAFGVLPPATRQSARRNLIMIGTHLLWGSLVSLIVKRFEE